MLKDLALVGAGAAVGGTAVYFYMHYAIRKTINAMLVSVQTATNAVKADAAKAVSDAKSAL